MTKMLVAVASDEGRKTFPSLADALAYLEPIVQLRKPRQMVVYGSRRAFANLRQKLKRATFNAMARDSEIINRWMSQTTSWSDYFECKDMREDAMRNRDLNVGWLTYGGPELPADTPSD